MRLPESAPDRIALIIGAMKSGTTTLFEVLSQHPQIAAATVKECDFFSEPEPWARGIAWYAGLWRWEPTVHRVALEASASYTTYPSRPDVPQRIAGVDGADFRFIYILRDPIRQIESSIRHTLYAGWGTSLDEGVPEWMIENASYAAQLERYLDVFPADRFLVLTLEEFSAQPAVVLRRVCSFLGVDADFDFARADSRYNSGEAYEMAAIWARLVRFEPLRAVANHLLPRGLRHWLRARMTRLPGRKAELGRHRMTEAEKDYVVARLSDDLRRLQETYGVPTDRYWSLDRGQRMRPPRDATASAAPAIA